MLTLALNQPGESDEWRKLIFDIERSTHRIFGTKRKSDKILLKA